VRACVVSTCVRACVECRRAVALFDDAFGCRRGTHTAAKKPQG
jgi:hypothetical protein